MSMFRRRLMITNALKKSDGNINYPGLIAAWSAAGKTNDDEDRATLKDLTGNGHDITLNGFAFSGMSGYGGYAYKVFLYPWFTGDRSYIDVNRNINYFILTFSKLKNSAFLWYNNFLFNGNALKLKVSGVSEDVVIYINYGSNRQNLINGENIILFDDLDNTLLYFATSTLFENANVRVELLPEYPDALVFDGVDDYGVNEDMPILTDYTIIVKRDRIEDVNKRWVARKADVTVNNSLFIFEGYNSTYSLGSITSISRLQDMISLQTKSSYNGIKSLNIGSGTDGTNFYLGALSKVNECFKGAFYSAYLFDRSLDEQEIKAFIRKYIDAEYVLPSEQV